MKYKLFILSLFISAASCCQSPHLLFWRKRNDSVFLIHVITPGDTVWFYAPSRNTSEFPLTDSSALNIRTETDTAKVNIRDQIYNLIGNNSTAAGRNILNVVPGGSPEFLGLNNNTVLQRTVPQIKQDLSIENVNNTADVDKPVSTATQTALNNKSTIYVGLDAGANDSYVITASPVPTSYTQGMIVLFRANTQNTTVCSINVNGLGVKNIVKRVSTNPATADILALMWCMLVYDGTNFVLLNPVVN